MFSIYAVRLTVDESYLGSFDFPVLHCADNASKMNGNRDPKRDQLRDILAGYMMQGFGFTMTSGKVIETHEREGDFKEG